MAAAAEVFEAVAPGRYRLHAELRFGSVRRVRAQAQALLAKAPGELVVDLSQVSRIDSAGLGLLVAWLAWAAETHRTLQYVELPAPLLALAKLSEVDRLLSG
jgi:phospholipid transport system transporter-binding protein